MKFNLQEINSLEILQNLSEEVFVWLIDHGERLDLLERDHMFTSGKPADYMYIVVNGLVHRYSEIGGQWLVVATTAPGQVTGMLPFSRMTHYPGHAIAAEPSKVLRLHKKNFIEMLGVSEELGKRLVAEMSNRVRGDVRLEQQREKMASLGRLSAGLAHELNNPAAAISSTAKGLENRLNDQTDLWMALTKAGIEVDTIETIGKWTRMIRERKAPYLSALQRSEKEEEITDWLEERAVANAWELSTVLAENGIGISDLDHFARSVSPAKIGDILSWVALDMEVGQMIGEITSAAGRISELISAVKNYSHMDQSMEHKQIDVRKGLDATLQMFGHKLNQKNITISRNYPDELPMVQANGGELNQVWTCLIDNAIEAMDKGGKLGIEISSTELAIDVRVIDSGKGIPEGIRPSIFDPFFTTKGVGEGTGLGLDIAQRIVKTHRGQIVVESEPGRTVMLVQLPPGEAMPDL